MATIQKLLQYIQAPCAPSRAHAPRWGYFLADGASEAQRKTADHTPSLAMSGSRPPWGDYPVVCASGCRTQAERSVRLQTTPPRSPCRAPVPRWGITLLLEFRHPLAQEFTIVTFCCRLCHPLTQEFTIVLRAGDSLPAVRKALGAVEG